MFGLSFWEIAVILAIALIVFGPSKLPELARSLGKGLREFRKATEDFKSSIDSEARRPDTPTPNPIAEKKPEALPETSDTEAEIVAETEKPAPAAAPNAVPREGDTAEATAPTDADAEKKESAEG